MTTESELDEARRELLDLDLVLPAACGSRVDAAKQLKADLDEARAQLAALWEPWCQIDNVVRGVTEGDEQIRWDLIQQIILNALSSFSQLRDERDQLAAALVGERVKALREAQDICREKNMASCPDALLGHILDDIACEIGEMADEAERGTR